MSFSLPGKRSHDRNSPDYVPSVFSFSKSHPKKINASTDRYQRYLKRQENENSLTDSESIYDIGESLLEKSVIQSSVLSASTDGISNEDSSLKFHVSRQNPVKEYMQKSVQTDEIKFLPGEVTTEKQKINLYEEIKEDKKLMNFYTGLPNNEFFLWFFILT